MSEKPVKKIPVVYNSRGNQKVTISVTVDKTNAEFIETEAKRYGVSRSKLANDLLEKERTHNE